MTRETKEQLKAKLSELIENTNKLLTDKDKRLEEMSKVLGKADTETRLAKQDSDRHQKNWHDCEERLKAIRLSIGATLDVKYKASIEPQSYWANGRQIDEEPSEEVRLLRHIFRLSNTQPPF